MVRSDMRKPQGGGGEITNKEKMEGHMEKTEQRNLRCGETKITWLGERRGRTSHQIQRKEDRWVGGCASGGEGCLYGRVSHERKGCLE